MAADIKCKDNYDRAVILGGLAEAGFVRIGLGDGFIHVDSDQDKAQPVIWLY